VEEEIQGGGAEVEECGCEAPVLGASVSEGTIYSSLPSEAASEVRKGRGVRINVPAISPTRRGSCSRVGRG
jgi:hypothetical protein